MLVGGPGVGIPEPLGSQAGVSRVLHTGLDLPLIGHIAESFGLSRCQMQLRQSVSVLPIVTQPRLHAEAGAETTSQGQLT